MNKIVRIVTIGLCVALFDPRFCWSVLGKDQDLIDHEKKPSDSQRRTTADRVEAIQAACSPQTLEKIIELSRRNVAMEEAREEEKRKRKEKFEAFVALAKLNQAREEREERERQEEQALRNLAAHFKAEHERQQRDLSPRTPTAVAH